MRRGVALVVGLLAGVALLTPPAWSTSPARRQRQIGQQLRTLRDQVEEASAQESALLGQLDDIDGRVVDLSAQVGALDHRLLAAQAEVDAAQAQLDALEVRYQAASRRLEDNRAALMVARDELRARAVSAYTEGPVLGAYAGAFLDGRSRDIAARDGYLATLVNQQDRVVRRYRRLRDEAVQLAASLEDARGQALTQRDIVAGRKADLQAARAAVDGIRQQVMAQRNQRVAVLEQVQQHKADFEAQIAALQAESASITSLLQTRQAGQSVQRSGHGVLSVPIPGAPITSTFGPRVHPIFHDVRMHTGIDFGASYGTAIRAAADGTVVRAGWFGGYGNATVVDHGRGLATLYGHQSRILVSEGQQVKKGAVIGLVGSTGFSTGPHLHFEVRIDGTPVNPLPYL